MNSDFKGLWVPKEIWLLEDLTLTERLFLAEISALDGAKGCYASNAHFSEMFNLSKNRCTEIIKSIEQKGYITVNLEIKGQQVLSRILAIRNLEQGTRNLEPPPTKRAKNGYSKNRTGYSKNRTPPPESAENGCSKSRIGYSKSRWGYSENRDGSYTNKNTKDNKKKNNKKKKFDPMSMRPADVSVSLFSDFVDFRKKKKATQSKISYNMLFREFKKSGLTNSACIEEMILRDWRGFKAEWIKKAEVKDNNEHRVPIMRMTPRQAYMASLGEALRQIDDGGENGFTIDDGKECAAQAICALP